jgi:hypothetical protein
MCISNVGLRQNSKLIQLHHSNPPPVINNSKQAPKSLDSLCVPILGSAWYGMARHGMDRAEHPKQYDHKLQSIIAFANVVSSLREVADIPHRHTFRDVCVVSRKTRH